MEASIGIEGPRLSQLIDDLILDREINLATSISVNVPYFIETEYLPESWGVNVRFRVRCRLDMLLECADRLGPCDLDHEDIIAAFASNQTV